jgi:MoaA/NifB/PqqE/SkfB family radical SAM enzyme/SAM-dependent methyltransferase
MKALIKVGYGCNENCTFCHTLDVRHVQGSSDEVHAKIDRAKALGHTMVVFSGGEATIRPELVEWFDHAVRLGLDTGLVTNGLMLAYPDFLGKLLDRRLRYVYMSMHAATPKVHRSLVRADTYGAALEAVRNLAGRGLDFTLNCVVARQNLDHLEELVDFVLPFPDVRLKFSMVQPKGGGDKLFEYLTPRVEEVGRKVREAIAHGLEKSGGRGPWLGHDGIPFCHLAGYEDRYDDLKTHGYWTMVEVGERDFFPVDDKAKVHPEPCRDCAIKGACPGLFRGYHEQFGHGELRPVTGRPRSNSFSWAFEALVSTSAPDDRCLIREDGPTPYDRGRHLFVKNGPRLARFRADGRDFTDAEIEHVKHGLGQAYLDASRKDAPDDFARDLVQLRPHALCAACPEEPVCTKLYEPVFEDVFTRDDEGVREVVRGLEGDVLDVGCGEGPYEALLAPLAASGRIRYTGLEPDGARVAALRGRWPWARLWCGTAEALAAGGLGQAAAAETFDHVLVLRSWNHLPGPATTLGFLARALRPGGTLTIVDNVAFGLARTPAQLRRAHGGRAVFEHHRNDAAADAERIVAQVAPGLEAVARREVGPGTSNQWLLRYRRPN